MKHLFLITTAMLLTISSPTTAAPQAQPMAAQTIGFDSNNPIATEMLHQALSRTGKATCSLNNQEHTLTTDETQELQALLAGAQSATPRCAPADCFYLNLLAADGSWLMSLPVQKTPQGIVLLYLKLQGNNAGAPLQGWWKSVSSRLGL